MDEEWFVKCSRWSYHHEVEEDEGRVVAKCL